MSSLPKKIGLTLGAIALSLVAAVLSIGPIITPGAYVVKKVFPPRSSGVYDIDAALLVYVGTNVLFFFAILTGVYIWRVKANARRHNVPR
jgi:hypothetical protein